MNSLDKTFLYDLGFKEPNIVENNSKELNVLKNLTGTWVMRQNDQQFMVWNECLKEVFEVYSHFMLAKGHCVCTGLGFALRENWLLNNKNVTKITVLESNKLVIDYHKKNNPDILEKLEIIDIDALYFTGKCDTLLIDSYADRLEHYEYINFSKTVMDNVKCDVSWFWPLEEILSTHYRNYVGLSLHTIYNNIKKYYDLKSLPNLSEEQLFDFCHKFYMGDFYPCNFDKINYA